jgi:hypothetical protein
MRGGPDPKAVTARSPLDMPDRHLADFAPTVRSFDGMTGADSFVKATRPLRLFVLREQLYRLVNLTRKNNK